MDDMHLKKYSWIKIILDDPDLNFYEKSLALYFSTFMNIQQDMAWPSYQRIQKDMKISPATISKYIRSLEKAGYLIIKKHKYQTRKGVHESNIYQINLPDKVLHDVKYPREKMDQGTSRGEVEGTSRGEVEVLHEVKCNKQENKQCNKQSMSGKPENPPQRNSKSSLKSQAIEILDFLNKKAGRNYKPVEANTKLIVARLREGYEFRELKQIIAKKTREWQHDENMRLYLRPATLFNATKCAQYVGELVAPAGKHVQPSSTGRH